MSLSFFGVNFFVKFKFKDFLFKINSSLKNNKNIPQTTRSRFEFSDCYLPVLAIKFEWNFEFLSSIRPLTREKVPI